MQNWLRQTGAAILVFLLFISACFHPHITLAESGEDGIYAETTTIGMEGTQVESGHLQASYSWLTECLDVLKRDGETGIWGEVYLPDKDGPVPLIIFSHEFLQSHASGAEYGKYFAARGIAVYTFDFINGAGNGRSDFTKVSGMTEAEDLEDVLVASKEWDFVDTEKIVLIGASFGCFPTAVCGINHQAEIAGMILLYPGLRFLEDIERFDDIDDVPETWDFHGITLGRNYVTDLWGYDIYEEMAKYSGKVLVLNGDNDQAISVEFARNVADSFPDADFKVIANGSYGFTGTALEDALECISEYLSHVI
ncbi:MAG: alpha/beta hydrolase [Flexilinea sp.]|nr:alpha/beta hydrolase [Flexilinea sp.]